MPEGYDGTEPRPAQQGLPGSEQAMLLDREVKGLRMKRLGASYDAIAKEMGYADASGARQMILRALDRQVSEHAAALRTLENQRLDMALQALLGIITDPSKTPDQRIRAADALTRNSARRARLNGLDAPVQIAVGAGALAELDDAIALFESTVRGEVVESHDHAPGQPDEPGRGSSADRGGSAEGDH